MKKITVTKAELNAVSIVDKPAIGVPAWLSVGGNAFVGAILIPDMGILRVADGEEFMLSFTKDCVADLGWQIYERDLFGAVDIDHSGKAVDGAEITNLWVEEPDFSLASEVGYRAGSIPMGTLMGRIELPADCSSEVLAKGLNGFSVDVTVTDYEESEE